ncbi:unnamed protein product [Gordionus sp. m RMFG-2023]
MIKVGILLIVAFLIENSIAFAEKSSRISNSEDRNIKWEDSGNCSGFEIPFQRKKCKPDNKNDCAAVMDRFFKCEKTGSGNEISSKNANDKRCIEIAKKLNKKGLYEYVKVKNSCQLKCKTMKKKLIQREFVVNGTTISGKALCIDGRIRELSGDGEEIVSRKLKNPLKFDKKKWKDFY